AMEDGLLRERQDYNLMYKDGKVYWDKELLGEPLQSKYAALSKNFLKAHSSNTNSFGMHGDGVTRKNLADPESAIRSKRINAGRNSEGEYYVNTVIRMMAKDGVLDTTQWHM